MGPGPKMTHVFQGPLEDLIGELVSGPGSPGWQVTHVLELSVEDEASLLAKLVLVHELLEQRKLDGLAGVTPELVTPASAAPGRSQGQAFAPEINIVRIESYSS